MSGISSLITKLYMVRHAESPYKENTERSRGLSAQGELDAERVTQRLLPESIDHLVSSPYERALATLRGLSITTGREIQIEEDLRERKLAGSDLIIGNRFAEAKKQVYDDFSYSFLGGESSRQAQKRAVAVIIRLLEEHAGKKIAIGTHGDIMTLMLNHFDPSYHYGFWLSTSMPDIYRLDFAGLNLQKVTRLWG